MKSKFGKLNLKDAAKSVTLFIVTSIGSALYASVVKDGLPDNLPAIISVAKPALLASVGYLFTNLIRNSKGELLRKEIVTE